MEKFSRFALAFARAVRLAWITVMIVSFGLFIFGWYTGWALAWMGGAAAFWLFATTPALFRVKLELEHRKEDGATGSIFISSMFYWNDVAVWLCIGAANLLLALGTIGAFGIEHGLGTGFRVWLGILMLLFGALVVLDHRLGRTYRRSSTFYRRVADAMFGLAVACLVLIMLF